MVCWGPNPAGDEVRCSIDSSFPAWVGNEGRKATKGTDLQTA